MKNGMVFVVLLAALLAVIILSLCSGQYDISVECVVAFFAHAVGLPVLPHVILTPEQEAVLLHIRLPRTIVGLLVGAGLGISGAVLQGIFSNPLADPGIIGVSSGASVGAVLAIGIGISASSVLLLPAFAFVGAMLAVGLTVSLSMRHGRIPVMTLLLSGVVVGMFLAACTAAILTVVNEQKMQQYLFWTIGGLDYRRWDHVLLGIAPIGIGASVMLLLARHLNLLAFGDVEALTAGMSVTPFRLLFLVLAALTTATGVCISGNIGFVGLVVPHMMRLIVGPDHRRLLPASLLAGAVFLVLCDSVGRILITGMEIRVGIMTAFIGTPYFLYLLRHRVKLEG
ncbi:iron chelate uptake ABC transporter, FeCT family, permease protein [Selenomonas flueggei ATCC 43531]|uniref:Iron chelate uptake ABC transporter, FeCT family, permease protein n=2 Tax=Selenomonas TaxID=970 RepID=C4V3K8_9FIRM|nr:iron chelate uptake ABC transporter, FeCT family, permease protein [Selenomonas flueggei ATCC 43531]